MIFAIFTAISYPLSAICGKQLTVIFGSQRANLYRLALATLILGAITLISFRDSFHPTTFAWLFFSGIIGFGLGDVALFYAYQAIGSRLTVLLNFCTATVFGLVTEYLWLGTTIRPLEMLAIALILCGLSIAVLFTPARPANGARRGSWGIGLTAAVVAGFGQGVGAVISRHAGALAARPEIGLGAINGLSQAFQRVVAGLVFAVIVVAIIQLRSSRRGQPVAAPAASLKKPRHVHLWLLGAAMFGPVIGVSCFQAALADLPSGIVLAIVSTSPIVIIPFAYLFEGDRPTRASCLGGIVGVAGVVWICLLRG